MGLGQLTISSHHFLVDLLLHPLKSDDLKRSTDKGNLINPYFLKNIPEQLRILGFNTLAALIERADLTNALQTRGPFTVFAPTDKAFEKFIGM